jgi:anionic cell wall polymer biosynthesis LytR-Cps2A-Psr (LCP) family protein
VGRRMDDQGVRGDRPLAAPTGPGTPGAPVWADGSGRWMPSRRRRRRVLAALLVLWAGFAIFVAYGWHQYGRLSRDLRVSNGRVGAPAKRALTPAPPGSARQTTLVAGIAADGREAGSLLLVRTDATRHAVELLTVPSTVRVSPAERLGDVLRFGGVPSAIAAIRSELGVPVNHLLLMHLDQASAIVRSLGGIAIQNPARVPYRVPGATGVFPEGRVALTGRTVAWYLDPVPSAHRPAPSAETAGDFRQAAVVRGVTDKLVHETTPSAIAAVGHTISRNFTTDLSPNTVLGMVAVRLRAHALVRCHLPADALLSGARSGTTLAGFRTASSQGACSSEALRTTLSGADVAATIIATIVEHGGSALLYWSVVAIIAVLGIGLTAWVLMLPSVRGARRRTRARGLPAAAAPAPRRTVARPALIPARRGKLPHAHRMSLPHVAVPRLARPGLTRTGRAPSPYGRRSRARTYGRTFAIRIISVPVSIGVGILIAHALY